MMTTNGHGLLGVTVEFWSTYTSTLLAEPEVLLYPPQIGAAVIFGGLRHRVAHVVWYRETRAIRTLFDPKLMTIEPRDREVWACKVLCSPQVGMDLRPEEEPPAEPAPGADDDPGRFTG